jgi:CHAT domain-containing protein
MLLAGLSEPGPVVDEYLRLLRGQAPSEPARAAQARGLVGVPLREITSEEVAVDEEQALTEQLRADLALPGVDDELASLSAVMPAYTLRNAEFVLAHLRAEIRKGYSLVHIATHGHFAGDPENSFIMTYDRFLTMNELARVLQAEAYAHDPLELLTLSACQTAQGDERSPLGLSGVAVQSGARSALGSLWPVSDEATQRLLTRFYAHLSEGRLNKAQSLRQAQLELLREEAFAHPFFWSPFVLIGDWR